MVWCVCWGVVSILPTNLLSFLMGKWKAVCEFFRATGKRKFWNQHHRSPQDIWPLLFRLLFWAWDLSLSGLSPVLRRLTGDQLQYSSTEMKGLGKCLSRYRAAWNWLFSFSLSTQHMLICANQSCDLEELQTGHFAHSYPACDERAGGFCLQSVTIPHINNSYHDFWFYIWITKRINATQPF